jgi:hypothetical protein
MSWGFIPTQLAKEGKKGSNSGDKGRICKEARVERTISRREESMFSTRALREKMRRMIVLVVRSHGNGFTSS